MFFGSYQHNMDAKNRVFVPAKFRGEMGEQLYLYKDRRLNRLRLYTEAEWENYLAPLFAKDDKDAAPLIHALTMRSLEVTLDSQGRITLDSRFAEFAKVEKSITFVGSGKYVALWGTEELERYNAETENDASLSLALDALGL